MKRKSIFRRIFVAAFLVLTVLILAADSVSAQCGNYFKMNYRAINKLAVQLGSAVYVDDWTGDGRADLWNFQWNGGSYSVVIYRAQPAGYWEWDNPISYPTTINNLNNGGTAHIVRDFDADGRKDLFFRSGDYRIHRNTGNGSLTPSPSFNDPDASSSNSSVGFADINGDNLLDWIYSVGFGSFPNQTFEIRYKLQNADGSFGSHVTMHTSSISSNKRLGDFNGDGRTDIIYSGVVNNQNVYVLIKNLGGGTFQAGAPVVDDLYVLMPPGYSNPVRDFNNDGRDDILSRDAVFFGQTDGTFNRVGITTNNDFLLAAELNGDNRPDIMEIGAGYYATHLNNGTGGFTRAQYQRNFEIRGNLRFADFSGDGRDDVYDEPSAAPIINKNIFGETLLTIRENICQPSGETGLANYDANENADLTLWNQATGAWSSKNAKWFTGIDPNTRFYNWGLGSLGDVPAPGDFDGDGTTDYAVYRNSTGVWYVLKSSDSTWFAFPFGLPGDVAVPNDYDGGGKTDIAVWRPSNGVWYIWFTEMQQFGAAHFGAPGDKAVPADYDGDGKTDLAVYRPSAGSWYYLKSSDLTYVVLHWGNETDIPLPADYDGDGRADVTIYRDGFWWIWRSSNNSYVVAQWGQAGDVPLPLYRNRVSADLVLYRPSNNSWYSFDNRFAAGIALDGTGGAPVRFGLPNN